MRSASAQPVVALCVLLACGGCSKGSGNGGSDGGAGGTGGSGGGNAMGAPVPDALAGRWWGVGGFSSSSPAGLAAFVPGEGGGPSLTNDEFPARVWTMMDGHSDVVLQPGTADSTWSISGLTVTDSCGTHPLIALLVATADALEIQQLGDGCDYPAGKVYATFHKSRAQRVVAENATIAALSADSRYLAFVAGMTLRLHDQQSGTLTDVATGVAGGLNPTPWVLKFSPDSSRLAYCKGPTTMSGPAFGGGELHLVDIATGHDSLVAQNIFCSVDSLQLSHDGGRIWFSTVEPPAATSFQVWDLATAAVVTTQAPYGTLTTSGRYVIARSGSPYQTLTSYDIDSGTTAMLGTEEYLQWSPDGKYLVFSRLDAMSNFHLSVWDESTGQATDIDLSAQYAPPGPTGMSTAPFLLGPDGRHILYYDKQQNLKLVTVDSTLPKTIVASLACNTTYAGAAPAFFSSDGTKVGYAIATACASNLKALHLYDVAGGTDAQDSSTSNSMFCAKCVGASGAITYWAADGTHVWSPATGDALVTLGCGVANTVVQPQIISDDGNRIYLSTTDNAIQPAVACLWDRAGNQLTTIASPTIMQPSSVSFFDAPSATVLEYNTYNRKLQIDRAGSGLIDFAAMVSSATEQRFAPSGRLFALPGGASDGDYWDVYAYSLSSGSGGIIEGGDVLAVSDSQIYFNAADGVVVADAP